MWLAVVLACSGGIALALGDIADRLLIRQAERTALGYVDFVRRSTPELETLFARGELTPDARQHLQRAQKLGDVFRFKMFDKNGHQLLLSDDLNTGTTAAPTRRE